MTEAPVRCLKCGLLLAGRSLEGLCAACLLESSLEPDPEPEEPTADVKCLSRRGLEVRMLVRALKLQLTGGEEPSSGP